MREKTPWESHPGPPAPPPSLPRAEERGGGGSLRRRDPGSMYRSRRNYYLLLIRWAASTILTSFRPPPPTNTHRSGSGGRFCDTGKCRTAPCKRAETYFLGFFSPGWALRITRVVSMLSTRMGGYPWSGLNISARLRPTVDRRVRASK